MKVQFHVTAERLVEKFCDCGEITEEGMQRLMDHLAQNTQVTHEESDVLILDGVEPNEHYEMRFHRVDSNGTRQALRDYPSHLQPKETP